ncbi:hypothetical protein H0H92_012313 [Tricholoma furcatifolium]|nr:hypothetical protein H0H92_012313 [Tricholoma furcatifolium]
MPKNAEDEDGEVVMTRPNLDPDAPDEGDAMDAENDDDAAMMAMMGLSGFGSTKGKSVEGNQEGAVYVKKQRTWRQYMNRWVCILVLDYTAYRQLATIGVEGSTGR